MRFLALLTACAVVAAVDAVDPCKRQPFRGRCPSKNGESPKRSQFVLRYYMRNGECVSYPYGHCASDESEPQLYRYKEECEDACINPPPANLGAPKDEFEQTYGTIGPVVNGVQTDQRNPSSTSTTTQVPSSSAMSEATTTSAIAESTATSTRATTTSEAPSSSPAFSAKDGETARSTTAESAPSKAEVPQKQEEVATKVAPLGSAEAAETSSTITVASTAEKLSTTKSVMTTTTTSKAPITTTTEPPTTPTTTTRRSTYTRTTVRTTTVQADNTSRSSVTRATTTAFPRTECERRRATAASSTIRGGFVPVCTPQGAFEKVQCEPDGRQCFCVDSRGIEIANSRTRNGQKPDCDGIQSSSVPRTKECVGGAVRGPCSATMNRWYYDEQEAKCNRFSYSGCGGNGNNYDSEDACIQRCAPPPMGLPRCEKGEPLKTKLGVTVNCAKSDCPYGYKCSIVQQTSVCCPENNKIIGLQTSASTDVCSLPKERGPCDKYELRFYFNAELKECKYFFWGGCEGNGNNFEKVEECESTCGIAKARENIPTTPRPAQSNRVHSFRTTQGIRITPGTFTRSEEAAVAHESHPTSTSAPSRTATASRRTFTSGATTSSESAATETSTQHTAAAAAVHVAPTRAPPVSEMALLEGSEDSSADSVNRCLHPKDPGNCRGQFIRWYWDSERKLCDVFTYTGCQGNGNNYASREECLAICHKEATPLVVNDFSTVCKHDVDAGECNGVFQRFAFDTESSECRPFTYGGCGGNGNNFATLAECRIKCQKVALSPGNLCEHDIEVGECSGVFVRFGYDKSNNDCRQFTYGGCGGNGNNFATIQECRNVCVKKVCNPNPQCDLARCQIVNDRNGCPFCSCPPLDQPSPPGAGQCPGVDAEKCIEPCIVINNRKGCKDCVCPTMPGAGSQPPASFDRPVSPPSPHNEDPTPRPALSSARPPASPSNVGPPSGSRRDSADNHLPRQESSITAHSSQRKQIESDSKQLLPPPLSAHLHEKCMQPVEPGPCKHFVDRWFFHAEDGTCHPFKYGGCAGNRNHFFSQNECEIHCARFLHRVIVPSTPLHVHENPTAVLEEKQPTKQHDDRQPDRLEPLARQRPPLDTLPSPLVTRPHNIQLDPPHSSANSVSTSRPATAVRLPFDLPASVRAHAIRSFVPDSNRTPSLATTPYYPETYEAWDFNLSRHKELEKTTSVPQTTTAAPLHTSQLAHTAATNDAPTTVEENATVAAIAPQRNSHSDRSSFPSSASLHPSDAEPKTNRLPLQQQIPVKLLVPLAEQVRPRTDILTPSTARSTAPELVERIGEHPVNASIIERQQHHFTGAVGQPQLSRQQSVATHPHVYKMNSIGDYNPQQNNNLAGLSPPVDPTYFTYNSQHLGGAGKRQFAVNSVPFGGQTPLTLSNWNQPQPARAMAPQTFAFAGPDQQELQPARQVFQAIQPQGNASPTPAGHEEQVLIGGQVFRSMQPQPIASQSLVRSISASGAAETGPNQATHHSQFNFKRVSNSDDTVIAGHLGVQNGAKPPLSQSAPDQRRESSSSIPFQAATDSGHLKQMSQRKPLTSDRSGPLDQETITSVRLQSNQWQAPSPREAARVSSTSSESGIRAQLHSDEGVGQGGGFAAPSRVPPSREGETLAKSTVQVEARPSQRIRIEPVRKEPTQNRTRLPHNQIQTQASERYGALQGNPELARQDNGKMDPQFFGQNRFKEPFTSPSSSTEVKNLQWRPPQNHHTSDRRVVYMNEPTQPQRSSFPRRTIENNRMVVSSQQNVASAVEQDILKTKTEWKNLNPQNSNADSKKALTENSKTARPTVDSARDEFPANFDRSKFIYYNGDYYAPTIPGIRVPRPDLVQPAEGPLLPSEKAPTAEMFREFQRRSKEFQSAAPIVKGGRSTTNDNAVHILDKSLYAKQQASVVSAPPVRLPDKRSRKLEEISESTSDNELPEFLRAPPANSSQTRPTHTLNQANQVRDLPYDNFPSHMQHVNTSLTDTSTNSAQHERPNSPTQLNIQPTGSITGIVSNDGEDGDGDDEGVPRRAAGVTQSHRREPIGVENYPPPLPTLRGVLQTHVAHGKKIAKVPVIHVDSMMSTSSAEAPEDSEVTRTDRPPTITGQRVSRITLRPPTPTEAPSTVSTTTRSTTITTVGTSPTTATQSQDTESTTVASVSQTSNITTEFLLTDTTTPQEVDAQPNTVTVSARTEESAARRVSTVDHTLPEFIRTSETPEIVESTTEAIEEQPQSVHPTRNPVSGTSSSQTDTAAEDTYLRTTTKAPDASTSTSTSSLVADSAAESTTSVDLSVILSTASTLSSTNGRVVTATEASTPEASPSNTGTLASIKAIAPSEATTASTTLGGNVDVDNSILNSTTLSTPLPTKEPHVAATVANSIDHFAKVYKSSENETVEFFDPDDLPPPPPENERRPVMSLAPRIAGEPIKPLKKIEILPKSVITAASPTTTTPLRTTGAPASTSTSSPSAASLEDDLTEIEGLSSFEVSSSEDMAGYSVGREPVPLSPIGIGRNMERLDLDGLEEPTTIIPLVLLASTSVKTDTDAASTATPTAGIQQTTAAATISTERTTTEALTTRAATTTEQKPTSTNAPAATPSTTWSPSTEAPITTPSVPPTTTTLPAPTTQTSTPPTPVATTAATTAPPPRRVLARGETQKGAVEFDARVVCALPPDVGTCFDYVPRWFFNAQSSQCEQFSYGSCGGNENNFADRNVCELKCMSAHTSVLSHVPERCTYERDGGFGKGYNVKWYFNMKNLRCEQFVYEGRGGNDNQFETLSDCERTCSPQPGLSSRVRAQPTVTSGRPPAPEQELRPNTVPAAPLPDKQTIEDILDYDEKLSQFVEDSEAAIPATHTPSVSNSIDSRVIISQAAVAPLPPTPEVVRSPGSQPRPPAVQAARTVVHREKAPEEKLKVATPEKKKEIYKAEPLPEKPPATGNEGLPIVGASPPMSVNYQTGEVKTKASGIRTFQESSSKVVVEDSDLTEGGEHRRDSLSCPNGLQEIRYADGRPVMCLPGKNQCPERSVCFFNGVDFFCCPNEEDPYDKHVFGGYDGEETKHGYKVFGPLNIRRLMDEVPLRVRRNTEAIRRRRQAPSSSTEHVPSSFNIDSITAPLRFDDEKPRQVSRALRMRAKPLPPHHGNPICIEPLSQGDCGAAHLRYFYDREADKCRLFYYSGCKGNSNNFGSLLDCQKLCVLGGQRPRPESASSSPPILRGQCPDGKTPLGGSAPVLCGNTTDSIGCPVGFYCLPGPPDVCCPNSAVESDADKESVRFAPEIPGVPRAHSRQTFLATPKFMCPDASDPLMGSNNEPTTCGAGFDGLKLCPKGFYCAIDVEKQSRMCCPLYGAAERVPTEQVVTPYLGRRPSNPGEVIERGSLPFDQGDLTSRAVNKHEMDEINNRKRAKVPVFETTASPFEDESEETMEDEEDEEDGMAHLMLKPADSSSQRADSSTSPPASVDVHAIDLPTDPPPVEELPAVKEVTDKSVCQIRPSEGRACREDEKPPRTNLHYFYSPKDRRCKLYFYRGCGGNANRFEKKIDCEQLCLP